MKYRRIIGLAVLPVALFFAACSQESNGNDIQSDIEIAEKEIAIAEEEVEIEQEEIQISTKISTDLTIADLNAFYQILVDAHPSLDALYRVHSINVEEIKLEFLNEIEQMPDYEVLSMHMPHMDEVFSNPDFVAFNQKLALSRQNNIDNNVNNNQAQDIENVTFEILDI